MIVSYISNEYLGRYISAIIYIENLGTGLALQRVYQNIIINLGDNFQTGDPYLNDKAIENKALVWINGQHDRPVMIENPGVVKFYVIAVKPGLLPFFISLPVAETNNKALSSMYWSKTNLVDLRNELLFLNHEQGFQKIEAWFTRIIRENNEAYPEQIAYIAQALSTQTVEQIYSHLKCSRKKLWSDVKYYFGNAVKDMQGIIRFDNHLLTIASNSSQTLSGMHNFYDQAHFINDFKKRTGMTPGHYQLLCKAYPETRHTPNFIPITKETFLQFRAKYKL